MKWKKLLFASVGLCVSLMLWSCKKAHEKASEGNPTGPEIIETEAPSSSTSEPWENASHQIKWILFSEPQLTDDNKNTINRILYEKGLDVRIDFLAKGAKSNQEYIDWVRNEVCPDILTAGSWFSPSLGYEFLKTDFLPLNNYLYTSEGGRLREAFGSVEWKKVTLDGNIYTVPRNSNRFSYNNAVYIAINNDYSESFASFDGTYASLKRIRKDLNNPEVKILFDYVEYDKVFALLGYHTVYKGMLPYDPQTGKLLDPARVAEEEKALCNSLFEDIKSGIIVNQAYDAAIPEKSLAIVFTGIRSEIPGYTIQVLLEDNYEVNPLMSYGVYRGSEQSELALQVLTACFSDPEISSIINWGIRDGAAWNERTRLMMTEQESNLTGFRPALSGEEEKSLKPYTQGQMELFMDLYRADLSGAMKLNSAYQPRAFYIDDSFAVGIDALNREIDQWFTSQEGQ